MRLRRQSDKSPVIIDTREPLGKGGEAHVFAIAGEPQMAAKLYEPDQDLQERALKLAIMRHNPPDLPASSAGHIPIAWPTDLLCDPQDGRLVGFLMPRVHDATQIIDYYNPRARLQHCPLFDYRYLMATARNLAAAVRAVHARGYVIGDLKHSNVLVTPTALVTLIDTDSFQVRDPQSERIYACTVRTPDFTPPELQDGRLAPSVLTPEQDLFALAVLIFHLLMEGTHPFAGVYEGVGDPPSFEERIAAGHFPYGHHPGPYHPGTRNAPPFTLPAPALRELFIRCFEQGHADPSARPDATTWQKALDEGKRALVRCAVHERHFYGDHLAGCPWCERMQAQGHGWNPFPARQVTPNVPLQTNGMPAYLQEMPPSPLSRRHSYSTDVGSAAIVAPYVAVIGFLIMGVMLVSAPQNTQPPPSYPYSYSVTPAPAIPPYVNYGAGSRSRPYPVTAPTLHTWNGGPVAAVAVSPDGKMIAGARQPVVLWNAVTGKVIHILDTSNAVVKSLAFSPDNKTLATGTILGEVKLWNVRTGQLRQRLNLNQSNSPGSFTGGNIMSTGQLRQRPSYLQYRNVNAMAFSRDGKRLATSSGLGQPIIVWDVRAGKCLPPLAGPFPFFIHSICFSPDNKTVAAGGFEQTRPNPGRVDLWNVNTTNSPVTWTDADELYEVAFSPDGKSLISYGQTPGGQSIKIWDKGTGHLMHTVVTPFRPQVGMGTKPAFLSADASTVVTAFYNCVQAWDVRTGTLKWTVGQRSTEVVSVALSPDGKTLISGNWYGAVNLWDVRTGERTHTFTVTGE